MKNLEEFLQELEDDGYMVPEEDTPQYATLLEAIDRAHKQGGHDYRHGNT